MDINEKIKIAETKTNRDPTQPQKKAGNYKKGKVTILGYKIAIENPIGSVRSGVGEDGHEWNNVATCPYGYFLGTKGNDGDPIDVYLGSEFNELYIYIIDQINPKTKSFDEHKVMFGFKSEDEAIKAYLSNFEKDWQGLGRISSIGKSQFKNWLYDNKIHNKPFYKIKNKYGIKNVVNEDTVVIYLDREVEEDITLKYLQSQITTDFNALVLDIASPGGSVIEGMRIMQWLNDLSVQGKFIMTIVSANAYSIASMIMLVANYRVISNHGQVMVHNPMVPELKYANAAELEENVRQLRELEEQMRNIYTAFTGLCDDDIKALLENETYLDPELSLKYGFVDEIINMKKKPYVMADANAIKHKILNMSKTRNIVNKILFALDGVKVVNQVYNTSQGGEDIEIYQLDPSTYAVGDRTNVESGEVQLSDGAKLTIEDYIITDIDKSVNPVEPVEPVGPIEPVEPIEPPAAVEPSSPNVGEPPVSIDPVEPVEPVSAEPVVPVVPTEPVVPVENGMEEMMAIVKEMQTTIKNLQAKIGELQQEKIADKVAELGTEVQAISVKVEDISKVQDTSIQAIDILGNHVGSNFKPVSKVNGGDTTQPTKTIFQLARDKAAASKTA